MVSNLGRLSYNKGKKRNLSLCKSNVLCKTVLEPHSSFCRSGMDERICLLATGLLQDFAASSSGCLHSPFPALVPDEASQKVLKLKIKACLCPDTLVKLRTLTNACEKCLKCFWMYLLCFGMISL